jgi:hypothetical protein
VEPVNIKQGNANSSSSEINYIKKEIQKDIQLPNNADLNTLESYLEDGYLYIECKLTNIDQSQVKSIPRTSALENYTFQNPLFGHKIQGFYSLNNSNKRRFISNDPYIDKRHSDRVNKDSRFDKSVRFDEKDTHFYTKFNSDTQRKSRSERYNRSISSVNLRSNASEKKIKSTENLHNQYLAQNPLHDGFHCVTRDLVISLLQYILLYNI